VGVMLFEVLWTIGIERARSLGRGVLCKLWVYYPSGR